MDLTAAINVLALTIHAHAGATTSRNMRMRSGIIDFNFRTTSPQ